MEYFTIDGKGEATYEISRSIFIANVMGIETFDEGMEFVKNVSKKYSDATHNCYAIIVKNGEQKFSDNGEPQGTAGMPILQVLKKKNLTNVACVITRYFGGIKLGAGGLVNAYTKSTVLGIENAKIINKKLSSVLKVNVDYTMLSTLNGVVSSYNLPIIDTEYGDSVKLTFAVPTTKESDFLSTLTEKSNGKITATKINSQYVTY